MNKILLPTFAESLEDVQTMWGLLVKTVSNNYEIGLEIIGRPEHFQKQSCLDQIKENITSLPNDAYIVIHGFSGVQVYESGMADMSTDKGRQLLGTYVDLAKDVGAEYIHVHGGAGYKGELLPDQEIYRLDKIRDNLLWAAGEAELGCEVGIELLTIPTLGDIEPDPDKVWRDYSERMVQCGYIIRGTNLKFTFDTCHYAASIKGDVDLITPVKKFKDNLCLLHISDVKGYWEPNKSTWVEGVVPGEGRIGEESFRNFFNYIADVHPDIGICVEVDNANFSNPVESKESIERILNWLK